MILCRSDTPPEDNVSVNTPLLDALTCHVTVLTEPEPAEVAPGQSSACWLYATGLTAAQSRPLRPAD